MVISSNPSTITIVPGPAPVGAQNLGVTEHDMSIAAHMDKIHFWAGAWQKQFSGSPLSQIVFSGGQDRIATASKANIGLTGLIGNRVAWSMPNDTNAKLNIPAATIPFEHTIYVAMQCAVSATIGLFGHTDGTGARLLLRADASGSARYDHSGVTSADILLGASKWTPGAPAILWASFSGGIAKLGGTTAGVVELTTATTKSGMANHKGGSGFSIGNQYGFFAQHRIGDVIVVNSDISTTDAHADILNALAAKYGLAVA